MMRLLPVIILMSALLGAASTAEAKDEALEIRHAEVGKVLILDFPGNRAMAHRWRLVTERSTGLQFVAVDPLGWIVADDGSIMYGNQDTMRYRVIPKASGMANLTFEHNYRGWNQKYYFKYRTIRVIVTPAGVKKQ